MLKKISLILVLAILVSTVLPSFSYASENTNEDFTREVKMSSAEASELNISEDVEITEKHSTETGVIETTISNDELDVDAVLETEFETGEIIYKGTIDDGNGTHEVDFDIKLTYVNDEEDFGAIFTDNITGVQYTYDSQYAEASIAPLIIIGAAVARFGIKYAIKKYGKKAVNKAIKSSSGKAASGIKRSLLNDKGYVIISKFTQRIDGKNPKYKEPKSKWTISRDRGKGNSHGGSYWKLEDAKGTRKATLTKEGKVLRK
jgi:hypothetical protein